MTEKPKRKQGGETAEVAEKNPAARQGTGAYLVPHEEQASEEPDEAS
jgi:hypothetical protein